MKRDDVACRAEDYKDASPRGIRTSVLEEPLFYLRRYRFSFAPPHRACPEFSRKEALYGEQHMKKSTEL
ncbi:hypothetical protein D3OALGB2SA_1247 [Olavius algarvensis associated proteobacterium Delta 3]|nr:hypothetical protein D3OALGB2SA_1247 [Olavius algarvensis associated proteobacterium Delta 3]